MGGCLSISLSGDDLIHSLSSLCGQGYIQNLKQNLKDLETEIEYLKAVRDGVENKVKLEETQPRKQMTKVVEVWLKNVEKAKTECDTLLDVRDEELQKLCLCDLGSKNVCESYKYGKRVLSLLEDVKRLKSDGQFEVVTEQTLTSRTVERPIGPTVGQEKMFQKAWNRLMEDEVGIMGLYGMGGVGKTTLFTKIHNKFTEYKDFNVIWIVVSQGATNSKLQGDIAEKLCICKEGWNNKNESDKATEIYTELNRKKFVLMLDDIWKEVDLKDIGVPFPTKDNRSKVAFTTRSQEVCARMGDHEPMKVECLGQEEAWELFKSMVGANTSRNDPAIEQLARKVADKCDGLPLALTIIGKTMAPKYTVKEWEHAVNVLTRSAVEYPDVEKILSTLKYSYDSLMDDHIKSCFLYCALFPEDYRISKGELINYWICEGIIDYNEGMDKAENKGYDVIGNLVGSSLLMEKEVDEVYMHDVVREMASWIASDCGNQKDNFIVQADTGLYEMPKRKTWNAVKRLSLMDNEIVRVSGSLECPQFTTLFLQKNMIQRGNISDEFFKSMPKLVVLDLSWNRALTELPSGISKLISLKYLNISRTAIECLPVSLQELTSIIYLDVENTRRHTSIVGISALLNLKVLKLYQQNELGYISTTKEELKVLEVLEHLEILTISIDGDSSLEEFLNSHKLTCCTQVLLIMFCQLKSSDILRLARLKNVRELVLNECTISEIEMGNASITKETVSPMENSKNGVFSSLSKIIIRVCKCPKDLTWLMLARNLTELIIVHGGDQLEEIINKEKACEEATGIVPFGKLKYLKLFYQQGLKTIYWRPLPFQCLTKLDVHCCPMLRKLPLNFQSGSSGEKGLIIDCFPEKNLERFEWEDKATKAFIYSCMN